MIHATEADKTRLLKLAKQHDAVAAHLKTIADAAAPMVKEHNANPAEALAAAPGMRNRSVHAHFRWLQEAIHAGELYFLTGSEACAQFAADRLNHYVQFLGVEGREPVVSVHGWQRDYRDVHERIALCYDFIQPFLIQKGTTVYDTATGGRIPFDHDKAQLMFRNIVEDGLAKNKGMSNITIMEADGILYSALCIEDRKQRDAYVHAFIHRERAGLLEMKKVLIENHGTWPESTSYSKVGQSVPLYMAIIDRLYPEYKIFEGFEEALNGVLDRLFFVYPNGVETLSFGDAHRKLSGNMRAPEHFIPIIRQAGFKRVALRFFGQIKADREKFGYRPDNLWAIDSLTEYEAKPIETQAIHLPYAGIIIQENVNTLNPTQYGLKYYTGGANYIHSHLTGLDLELYGAGCVMSGVGGSPSVEGRGSDIFKEYYRIYAGHNTVVINGESVGGRKGWKGHWVGGMDTVKLDAAEPMPYTPSVSDNFTFSSQTLNDTVNKATQQRTVSIIRTGETSGYYLDLFRSRSKKEDKFHDYIYHNIGEGLLLTNADGEQLPLKAEEDRYPSRPMKERNGNTLDFPGWKYFSQIKASEPTSDMICGIFPVDIKNKARETGRFIEGVRYMHVKMPAGTTRKYTSAEAPPIIEAAGHYDDKPARILSIRQQGEAWDRPFVVVYEPSLNAEPTVQSVETIVSDGKVVGATVVSIVDGKRIVDRIIAHDRADATYNDADLPLTFTGRFAIVRTIQSETNEKYELYIGDGKELSFKQRQMTAENGSAFRRF